MALLIRPATAADAAAIRAIYAPIVERTFISFEETAPSVAEIAARIAAAEGAYPYLVAEAEGRLPGYAYASPHRTRTAYRYSADVSVYVAPAMLRQHVARTLYVRLLADLAGRGFHAAFAGIALPNAASVAFHEAMGFTPVGVFREVGFKLGAWRDVGWWQRILEPGPAGSDGDGGGAGLSPLHGPQARSTR